MSDLQTKTEVPLSAWRDHWPGGDRYQQEGPLTSGDPWDSRSTAALPDPLPAHVGLWLDRCLVEPERVKKDERPAGGGRGPREFVQVEPERVKKDERPAEGKMGRDALQRSAVMALAQSTPALSMYQLAFKRWQDSARQTTASAVRQVLELRALSRILLHPATATSVTEGSVLLHHTYGVPYLPGSALKGICRARARRLGWLCPARYEALLGPGDGSQLLKRSTGRNGEPWWVAQLFGYVEAGTEGGMGGLFDFWDALWIPVVGANQATTSPLARDIVNPHHSSYYTDTKHPAPSPTDSPIPTHLLSVCPGTHFLLVLEAPRLPGMDAWLNFILDELLLPALALDGIGAKTAAGYGRLTTVEPRTRLGAFVTAAGSSGSSASAALAGAEERVEPGMVIRRKNDGTLRATLSNNAVAELRGPRAAEMYARLSEDVRKKIDRGKEHRLIVRWLKRGNEHQIIDLQEP